MRTINKIITEMNCSRGAPTGRMNIGVKPTNKRINDCIVPLNNGGYDKGGAYWGIGKPLRVSYTKSLTYINFYREK